MIRPPVYANVNITGTMRNPAGVEQIQPLISLKLFELEPWPEGRFRLLLKLNSKDFNRKVAILFYELLTAEGTYQIVSAGIYLCGDIPHRKSGNVSLKLIYVIKIEGVMNNFRFFREGASEMINLRTVRTLCHCL